MTSADEPHKYDKYGRIREQLLLALTGDEEAYRDFLVELRAAIEKYLLGVRIGEEERQDLTQDVLISVHLARGTYQSSRPFGPWLVTIIRRRLIDRYRSQKRFLAEDIFEYPEIEQKGLNIEDAFSLEQILGKLKPIQREAVIATEIYGEDPRSQAQKLGVSDSAFRVMLHRAIKSMRAMIEV